MKVKHNQSLIHQFIHAVDEFDIWKPSNTASGTSFQFCPGGSKILTDFLGWGAKYEKYKIL